jgi:hypothetical protein
MFAVCWCHAFGDQTRLIYVTLVVMVVVLLSLFHKRK